MDRNTRQVLLENRGDDFIDNGVRKALYEIGKLVEKETKKGILKPPKTGRYYKYKSRRKRASKPGEYPANRSGTLRRSINFKVNGSKNVIIGAEAPYGVYLEEGTEKMERRKLLGFTIGKHRNKIKDIVIKNVNSELKAKK